MLKLCSGLISSHCRVHRLHERQLFNFLAFFWKVLQISHDSTRHKTDTVLRKPTNHGRQQVELSFYCKFYVKYALFTCNTNYLDGKTVIPSTNVYTQELKKIPLIYLKACQLSTNLITKLHGCSVR